MKERRHDVDWLRNLCILLLFPFHAARVFDIFEPNYVKNAVWTPGLELFGSHPGMSDGLSLFLFYTGYWFMPLMFVLAGMSTWFALRKRSGGEYRRERVSRLLIPFLFGLLVIVPPQGYMARLAQGYSGGYFRYLLGYFTDFSDLSGYYGTFTPAHLWFILYLFIISLAVLPLLLLLRRRLAAAGPGKPLPLLEWLSKPAVFLLLPVPLTLLEALPDIGGKNIFFFAALFLLGALITADDRIQTMLNRLRFPALLALPVCLVIFTLMVFRWGFGQYPDISFQQAGMALVRNLTLLLTLAVLLGYGSKFLNRDAKVLPYLNRAAYPVYILHQTVMMVVAFFVVRWALPMGTKYALIIVLTLLSTLGLYEFAIRRFRPMRFLFGVK